MLLLAAVHANSSLKALLYAQRYQGQLLHGHVVRIHNINFNELLWNYKFIFYENLFSLKIRLFAKILYYENLELYGNQLARVWIQLTSGVYLMRQLHSYVIALALEKGLISGYIRNYLNIRVIILTATYQLYPLNFHASMFKLVQLSITTVVTQHSVNSSIQQLKLSVFKNAENLLMNCMHLWK